jgi:hypothetical protein
MALKRDAPFLTGWLWWFLAKAPKKWPHGLRLPAGFSAPILVLITPIM